MPGLHLEQLQLPDRPRSRYESRWWRNWCFARAAFVKFRVRLLVMGTLLAGGGLAFRLLEPDKKHSYAEAVFYVWSLTFGNPPDEFPASVPLQVLYFLVPVAGLVIVLEALVEFAALLRDRRHSERAWCVMMASLMSDHIVLVGLGKLGIRTFRLLRKLGEPVVVVERSADNPFLDDVRGDGAPLLLGDGRRDELLAEAGVARARSVILASNDDLANLEMALDARRMNPRIRVVLRMFDQNMADKIRDGFDIHIAMSQSAMSAPAFAVAALDGQIVNSFVVENQLVVMQRWTVRPGGPLVGRTVGDVTSTFSLSIVERRSPHGDARLFPPPDVKLEANDRLVVQGLFTELRKLRDLRETPVRRDTRT